MQERLGHPASARLLILHADDLGMSRSVNRATFEALEKGWITSASVLVPCPWFPDVARWAKTHPEADLGIHLALNSEWTGYRWPSLTGAASLSDPDGYMPLLEEAVVANARPAEIEAELRAQIARARAAGVRISHVDSHMATLFRTPELFAIYRKVGTDAGVPFLIERVGERGGAASAWAVGPQEDALVDRVVSINPGPNGRDLGGRVREDAGPAAPRRLPAHPSPRLRRRGDARRDLRPSELGRGLAAAGPRPREERAVPGFPEGAGLRAREAGAT